MKKIDIVKDYRTKHPEMPTAKLARIIYNEHNLLFANTESVRTTLRIIEGKSGAKNRKYTDNKTSEFYRENRPFNPYNLPNSD